MFVPDLNNSRFCGFTIFSSILYIGVRGVPERDIPSLGAMGWGVEVSGNSSAVVAVVVAVAVVVVHPKSTVLGKNKNPVF